MEIIHRNGVLSIAVTRALLYQIGSGLAYAHRRKIYHRDVKPANVLVSAADGGAVVTETVFSVPGTGSLFVTAILARDFPVMLGVSMLIIVGVVLMNLVADLLYTVANPRIRLT